MPQLNAFGLAPVPGLASAPSLGDLDGDGDLDLVAGNSLGQFAYFENTGDADSPAFIARTGATNPFDTKDVGIDSTPALGDFDGDGNLDLVAGDITGVLAYFQNQGGATSSLFRQLTGAANPLDGEDVSDRSAPARGDLDGDGVLDLVSGEYLGVFHTYYLQEPARGLLLGAGITTAPGARARASAGEHEPMKTMSAVVSLALVTCAASAGALTDVFGTGANEFSIDFVGIGDPGNPAGKPRATPIPAARSLSLPDRDL